jgi:hypothetical protein
METKKTAADVATTAKDKADVISQGDWTSLPKCNAAHVNLTFSAILVHFSENCYGGIAEIKLGLFRLFSLAIFEK